MRSLERGSGIGSLWHCDLAYKILNYLTSSKSELKKRIKQREQEEKKAAKQAAHPHVQAQTAKKSSTEDAEAELTPNVCPVVTHSHNDY